MSSLDEITTRRILGQILHLFPSIPSEGSSFSTTLATLVEKLSNGVDRELAEVSWRESGIWNDSHVLAEALVVVESFCSVSTVKDDVRLRLVETGVIEGIMKTCSWNREVLERVAALVELWQDEIR